MGTYDAYQASEILYLRQNWDKRTHAEIGKALGRPEQGIRTKLWEMGLVDRGDNWSAEEIKVLIGFYENPRRNFRINSVMASLVNRTRHSIANKAHILGLTNAQRWLPVEELSEHNQKLIYWHSLSSEKKHQIISVRQRNTIRQYGHPRGCRVIKVCPICRRFFDERRSNPKVYCSQKCSYRRPRAVALYSRGVVGKRVDLGGRYFRSSYEANYARYLNFLIEHRDDNIIRWEYEVDTFEFVKIKRGVRFYTPDFKIFHKDGTYEYHEVKGWDYPKGKTARKRMAKYYPHIKIILVDADFFKAIRRQGFNKLIPNWE